MATPQEAARDNVAAAGASANKGILHGTLTDDNNEAEDDDIEEVDMPQNDPTELINVDAGSNGIKNKEEKDKNPVDTSPDMPVITAVDDRTDGNNTNGAVEMEDVEEGDDGNDANDSKDEDDSTK